MVKINNNKFNELVEYPTGTTVHIFPEQITDINLPQIANTGKWTMNKLVAYRDGRKGLVCAANPDITTLLADPPILSAGYYIGNTIRCFLHGVCVFVPCPVRHHTRILTMSFSRPF